jgi:hypothetical protein
MVGVKPVTEFFEFLTEFCVVIDLTVKRHDEALVCSDHRLRTAGEVQDRKAPMSEEYLLIGPDARSIGSAMSERVDHPFQIQSFPPPYEAGDSAHGASERSRFAVRGSRFVVGVLAFAVRRLQFGLFR